MPADASTYHQLRRTCFSVNIQFSKILSCFRTFSCASTLAGLRSRVCPLALPHSPEKLRRNTSPCSKGLLPTFSVVLVGLGRVELPTSPLSGVRSNQLSYRPSVLVELIGIEPTTS